uniref:hypothetical protein n=1 Tax=Breoghania sp. TaxID=2065378 RepID=UPI0026214EE6
MKNVFRYTLFSLFLFFGTIRNIYAQTLQGIGKYDGKVIKIRWSSSDLSVLNTGFKNGYKIEKRPLFTDRFEWVNGGKNVFPFTLSAFERAFQQDSSAAMIAELVHNPENRLSLGNGLEDADRISNKLMIIHYLSEIDSQNA